MLKHLEDEKKTNSYLDIGDRQLVTLILEGNNKVVTSFFVQKCKWIFEYLNKTRLKGLNLQTDDLVNDFYLFLQEDNWEKLRQFRFESKLQTWINVVASRYFLKKYSRELKETSRDCPPIDSILSFVCEDADERLVRSEVLEAISYLNDKRSKLILLLDLQGFESKEIADQLGISTNNVYVLRSRAIKNLKNLLNG
ncbi:MAG: sigma-70 family RNA polymerase sigma factor [Bacteroidetes bacterium]|nr:sigma-70 family RNA polymerase sigma factor [Bacteroidota bacterium]